MDKRTGRFALSVIAIVAVSLVLAAIIRVDKTVTDTLTAIAAGLGVLVAVIAAWAALAAREDAKGAANNAHQAQRDLVAVQIRLKDIEEERLERERRDEAEELAASTELRLNVASEYDGKNYRVVIENVGSVEVHDVLIRFHSPHEEVLVGDQMEMPIPLLRPNDRVPLLLATAMGRWFPFDYTLQWLDRESRLQERDGTLYQP